MDKYKPITPETKKSYRTTGFQFITVGALVLVFSIVPILRGWGESPYWGATIFAIVIISTGIYIGFFINRELTEEGKRQDKFNEENFWQNVYVRHIGAIVLLAMAYFAYSAWAFSIENGVRLHTILKLFANPYFPIIAVCIAIINAWELSIGLLFVAIVVLFFQGLMALPISVAILVGAAIIAYTIHKKA